jgi:hypothetical protein
MKWIKVFFWLIVFCVFIGHIHAQSITVFGGINHGGFYSVRAEGGHFKKKFNRRMGYFAGIEITDIKIDSVWNFTIGIGIEQYGGSFYARDGGLGGYSHVKGELKKESLFLTFSPINIQMFKHAFIRPGLSFNYELHKTISGEYYSWNMSTPQPIIHNLRDDADFTNPLNGGINLLCGYSFEFNKFSIETRYSFFCGLSREMNNSQAIVNSFRHGLSVGVKLR